MIAPQPRQPTAPPALDQAVSTLGAHYADLWRAVDALIAQIGPADWSRRHGKHWTVADVPFHLAYFDAEVVCQPIERRGGDGAGRPALMRSVREMNAWNARHFAERPADQTPAQSLAQLEQSRARLRRLLASLGDADLEQRVWIPLLGCGWVTIEVALRIGIAHTWSHLLQVRVHLGRSAGLEVDPATTHAALATFVQLLPLGVRRDAAARLRTPFQAALEFSGPAGGCWLVTVSADGQCQVEERPAPPGVPLRLRQSPQTFELLRTDMANPLWLLLSGQLRVRGWRALGTFGRLFPKPGLDTPIEPLAAAA